MTDTRDPAPAGDHGSRPRRDPNLTLLGWRLALALVVTAAAWFIRAFDPERLAVPGLVASLGLHYTSLAVAWAATMAGAARRPLLVAQLTVDVACIALLVHFTGGPYSAFPLLFCLPIMLAAALLDGRWAVTLAGGAAVATGGGHFGLALGWLIAGKHMELDYLQGWPVMVTALHMSLFLVTGMLSGDLARRLARRRENELRSAVQVQKARCEVRNILDNIKSGLLTVDRSGLVTRVNPTCCSILQLPESELVGRQLEQAMTGGLEELADVVLPVARGGDAVSRGEVQLRRWGREMPLGLSVNHVTTPRGKIIGAIVIFADLTREKEMGQRIREADRLAAVGELAASIAHEIRNPLASIRGSVEILAGELELAGYQRQLFDLVLKESGRVNTIISDFLNYSRMRPATMRLVKAGAFRDEISLQIRQHISAKGGRVQVVCDIDAEDQELVADPGQLTQMTLNLAINACQAMRYAGELRIRLGQTDAGENCELVVMDTGPGIDPEIRQDLFSPFKTTKEGGTGLGLSIVARIASAHGGRVVAEDAPGGGAVFRVSWPQHRHLVVADDEEPTPLPPVDDSVQLLLS